MEMIQAVISRLAGNSFLMKGWAITVSGAFLGFGVDRNDSELAAGAVVAILVFGGLDTYYLRTERLFRVLYDQVRKGDPKVDAFSMAATTPEFKRRVSTRDTGAEPRSASVRATLLRPVIWLFYGALLVAAGLV